jgi:hypothetical protein
LEKRRNWRTVMTEEKFEWTHLGCDMKYTIRKRDVGNAAKFEIIMSGGNQLGVHNEDKLELSFHGEWEFQGLLLALKIASKEFNLPEMDADF